MVSRSHKTDMKVQLSSLRNKHTYVHRTFPFYNIMGDRSYIGESISQVLKIQGWPVVKEILTQSDLEMELQTFYLNQLKAQLLETE